MGEAIKRYAENRSDVSIFDCTGPITFLFGAVGFGQALQKEIRNANSNILLNLVWVERMDSTALGWLRICIAEARDKGGDIKLLNAPHSVLRLLAPISGQFPFERFNNEQEAIASFRTAFRPGGESASIAEPTQGPR